MAESRACLTLEDFLELALEEEIRAPRRALLLRFQTLAFQGARRRRFPTLEALQPRPSLTMLVEALAAVECPILAELGVLEEQEAQELRLPLRLLVLVLAVRVTPTFKEETTTTTRTTTTLLPLPTLVSRALRQ